MEQDRRPARTDGEEIVTDLFAEDVNVARKENELDRVRKSAAEKAYRYRPLSSEESSGTHVPGIGDFSDSAVYAKNQLNPEIQLTSVETTEAISRKKQDDITLFVNEGKFPSFEKQVQPDVRPAVQADTIPAGPAVSVSEPTQATNFHGKYDYDYDAEDDSPESQIYQTEPEKVLTREDLENEKIQLQLKAEAEKEKRDEKAKKDRQQRILTISVMSAIAALVLAAIILVLIPDKNKKDKDPVVPESSSQVSKDQQTYSGIITQLDVKNGSMLVYNADKKSERSFLTKKGDGVSMNELKVGDIIDVVYDAANKDALMSIMNCAKAQSIENVTGVSVTGMQITLNQTVYTLDEFLICTYNGQSYPVSNIDANTVFSAKVLNGHCYMITVSSTAGQLTISNLGDYKDGTLNVIPDRGEKVEKKITTDVVSVTVPEGSVEVTITLEGELVYQGRVFVTNAKETELTVTDKAEDNGTVVFSTDIDEKATVSIDGQEYMTDAGITLEYGDYEGTVTADGYKDEDISFTLDSSYLVVKIEMEKATAEVTINANVNGFQVWVDGAFEDEANGSSATVYLEEGSHYIVCTKEGYEEQGETIYIDSDLESQTIIMGGFKERKEEESSKPEESSSKPEESSSEPQESSSAPEESSAVPEESSSVPESDPAESSQTSPETEESSQESNVPDPNEENTNGDSSQNSEAE